jgi:hypothetical protein
MPRQARSKLADASGKVRPGVPHDWLDVGLGGQRQRFCCTPYAKGGCGAHQIFTSRGMWEPTVAPTCTAEKLRRCGWK